MLRSYAAIYDHGRVEWIGAGSRLDHGRVLLVVVEESTDPVDAAETNGDRLADFLDSLGIEVGGGLRCGGARGCAA